MAKAKQDLSDPTVQGHRVVDLQDAIEPPAAPEGSATREAAQRLVKRDRATQGLSERITDAGIIGRVAALLQPIIED